MTLGRVGNAGSEQPVVADSDGTFSIRPITEEIDGAFLERDGIEQVRAALERGALDPVEVTNARFGSPVVPPGLLVCVGLNYRQHAIETGAEIPTEPVLFMKSPRCVIGPNDDVLIPRGSTSTDWEVELAIIIGRRAHYLESAEAARSRIAGFTISHDVSERSFQLERGGQWVKGKSCDTFNPLGPWLVPADEVDPDHLGLRLWVNDELRQDSNTSDMIFDVVHLVHYISQFMVLDAGDVITTGTPAGVALGLPGQPYLRAGDVTRLQIDELGDQRQLIGQA
jgi:2-keto-4-pentenoate hydratase/2-oxohepta-3-ene-1,7-dioic acid hydratase in catechol pathway